jgi:hypothetical protein
MLYITISITSQQREREQVGHTGANNKDYHAHKPIYVRANSLVGTGDVEPNRLYNAGKLK